MKSEEFKMLVEKRIVSYENKLFGDKEAEYSRGEDRLHNFKAAGCIDNETPERALWGMMKKHLVSIKDMIDDLNIIGKNGDFCFPLLPSDDAVTEKFDDMHNYLHLLEALIVERKQTNRYIDSLRISTSTGRAEP